jgi:hypothetical protein
MHTSIHNGGTENHPAFPTQWCCGFLRAHQFAKRVKAAAPKLTWAKAGAASRSGRQASRMAYAALVPKISKTTPCKVAWRSLACAIPRRQFDTSGKSPAIFHHRAICKTQTNLAAGLGRLDAGLHRPQHSRSLRAPLLTAHEDLCPATSCAHDSVAQKAQSTVSARQGRGSRSALRPLTATRGARSPNGSPTTTMNDLTPRSNTRPLRAYAVTFTATGGRLRNPTSSADRPLLHLRQPA